MSETETIHPVRVAVAGDVFMKRDSLWYCETDGSKSSEPLSPDGALAGTLDLLAMTLGALRVTRESLETVQQHADGVARLVGCGDHSCWFKAPTSMGTNGGCRCARRPGVMEALARLYKAALHEEVTP